MSNKNQKKLYTLEYIEKIFKVIPLTFILILAIISIFISYVLLDSKQKREIDLLKQKEALHNEFSKKELLLDFSTRVKSGVDLKLIEIEKMLQEHTYKIIGTLSNSYANSTLNDVIKFLSEYEKKSGIGVVFFDEESLNIIYGKKRIDYLSSLIFGKSDLSYKKIVLKYIHSQGRYNTQEWKNDLTGALRLTFFDLLKVKGKRYFVGTFSNVDNIRVITKKTIIDEIDLLKQNIDYNIWFLDFITKITYNFNGKKKYDTTDVILAKQKENIKYEILKYFHRYEEPNEAFNNYILYDNRFKFLISIDYDKNIFVDEGKIVQKYNSLFISVAIYIIVSAVALIIFSLLFSNFTKKILDRYNDELQQRTDSLIHWKNRFELAVIASNDGLWDIDFSEDKIFFSEKWLEISGYKKGELTKFSHWFNLIHKDDKTKVENLFEEIFAGRRDDFICEYRLKTKSKGFKWIFARGRVFIDEKTSKKRMLMMSMDIDKNKRMKKELLDVELLVQDGKIVLFKLLNDENLSVKYISNAIKNYGYSKFSFEKAEMNFLDLIHNEDINIVKVAMNAALNQDLSDFTFVCRALNAANEIRWISCRTLLLKDHFGNVSHFYGYINDITKIKLSEQQLKQKVEEELNKNREKDRLLIQQNKLAAMGEMIGNIAHQWRQPLNNVSLFLQFLKDSYKNENKNIKLVEKYFDKSFTQIEYMSQTIDDFRNFYKPSKQKSFFTIKHAIDSTLDIIKAQLKSEDIHLELKLDNVKLFGFENELKQSFLNIFNNAQDAIKQRRQSEGFKAFIKVFTQLEDNVLSIYIQNNGGVIKKEIISRVFEPYFTTKFESQGTGIGLYMTKSIIESNMKGKIEVKNLEDGVSFKISLPIKKEDDNE